MESIPLYSESPYLFDRSSIPSHPSIVCFNYTIGGEEVFGAFVNRFLMPPYPKMNFVLIFSLYTSKRLPFSPCIYEGPFFACPFSICITHPQKPKTTVVQGGDSLEISIRDAQKIVEVWLTNCGKATAAVPGVPETEIYRSGVSVRQRRSVWLHARPAALQ